MGKRLILVMAAIILLGGVLFLIKPRGTTAQSLDQAYASPVNGGCYIAAPNVCKIHVDPFTMIFDAGSGKQLAGIRLVANGSIIYDFKTDVSNPPGAGSYTPSLVAQDFAAACGEVYSIYLQVKTQDNLNYLNSGAIFDVTCPSAVP